MIRIKKNELIEKDGKGYYNGELFTGIQVWENYNGSLLNEFEYNEGLKLLNFLNGRKTLTHDTLCFDNENNSSV